MPNLNAQLQQYFGFNEFRGGQREVVEALVAGHSAMAIFPTGSGKSLCYQLAALQLPHLTLVISPLLALMRDQLDFLAQKGIAAAAIDSSQSRDEAQDVMARAKSGELKILMISVERLKNERFRRFIAQVPLSLLVVDEAHCISEWGHNFRPDYLKLPQAKAQLNIPQALLLTATATPTVVADMAAKFAIAPEHITVTGFYRSNLHLHIRPVASADKHAALLKLLQRTPDAPCVVYVTQQDTAERVAAALQTVGFNATAYHAGIENERRQQIQDDFMCGRSLIIVATIAFGMGIDKSNIRQVIHYDLPKSIENYSQEIGRAGRDGEQSLCTLLGNREGLAVLENFVYGDTPEQAAIEQVLSRIQSETLTASNKSGNEWEMTIYDVSAQSNIRQLPLKTLLVYLEIQGLIEPLYSYYSDYRFALNIELDELFGHFKDERQDFVRGIFRNAKFGRSWYQFDFASFQHEFPEQRARAVTALEYMDEKGWLRLEVKQMTEVYRVPSTQFDSATLAAQLHAQFQQKEHSELQRLNQMLALFETTTCLSHALAAHFGDTQAPTHCGHCLVCRGKPAQLPAADSLTPISNYSAFDLTAELREKAPNASVHVLACFLCGITLPILSRVKASKMRHFGQLSAHPFAEVRAWLAEAFAVQC